MTTIVQSTSNYNWNHLLPAESNRSVDDEIRSITNHYDVLGFLRISKTASTSMIDFLLRHNDLHSMNSLFSKRELRNERKPIFECMYTSFNISASYDAEEKKKNVGAADRCPHPSYRFLKKKWMESLSILHSGPNQNQNYTFSFHPFTIIR